MSHPLLPLPRLAAANPLARKSAETKMPPSAAASLFRAGKGAWQPGLWIARVFGAGVIVAGLLLAACQPAPAPVPLPPTVLPANMRVSPADGMAMVVVPAGPFQMGSDAGYSDDEQPVHTVKLDAFWIDRTAVTNAMFRKFVAATKYQTDAEKGQGGNSVVFNTSTKDWDETQGADWQHPRGPSSNISGLDDYPVVQVSWNDANAYCQWAGRRLPTEAEWEKAARGTDGRTYPWGNQDPAGNSLNFADRNLDVSWAATNVDDGYQFAAPVGHYPAGASPYGALDMAGNVWQWVADWYDATYYDGSPDQNPLGPPSGAGRVLRGGAWNSVFVLVRTSSRGKNLINNRGDSLGFRCASSQ